MERLTLTDGAFVPWAHKRDILERLRAYENTGLAPEEINELLHDSTGPLHRKLGEWIDAERDGRLHVLPCKIGTDIFAYWGGKIVPGVVIGFHLYEWAEGCSVRVLFDTKKLNGARDFSFDAFGKTLFFTKEETATALKGSVE